MSFSAPYRLPNGWTPPESVADVIVADEIEIHRAGLSTVGSDGEEVVGAAADISGPADARAWFELLERVSSHEAMRGARGSHAVLREDGSSVGSMNASELFPESEAPERWRYARSNGVALHVDWGTACHRARWELAERDRVIRSWHGELRPERIDLPLAALGKAKSFDWRAYSFPEIDPEAFSYGIEVVGVFGFPLRDGVPFVLGLAGRDESGAALEAARMEAIQLLAFLWGEPAPESAPANPGPMQHLDTYQVRGAHAIVRRWLEGGHLQYRRERHRPRRPVPIRYVDLTPDWLGSYQLRVVKAISEEATPLVFGHSPFSAHLPEEARLHPIP